MKKLTPALVALAALVASTASQAAITVDVTPITTDAATATSTIGGAVFTLFVGMRIWKWIRKML